MRSLEETEKDGLRVAWKCRTGKRGTKFEYYWRSSYVIVKNKQYYHVCMLSYENVFFLFVVWLPAFVQCSFCYLLPSFYFPGPAFSIWSAIFRSCIFNAPDRWPARPYNSSSAGSRAVLRHRAAAAACTCITVDAAAAAAYCTSDGAAKIRPADGFLHNHCPNSRGFTKAFF